MIFGSEFLGRGTWPPEQVAQKWGEVGAWQDLRDNKQDQVWAEAQAQGLAPASTNKRHIQVPIAGLIPRVSSTLVCGGPARFLAGVEEDKDNLEAIVGHNDLKQIIDRAAFLSSSESEAYARVYVDDSTPRGRKVPILEVLSTTRVIPIFKGSELIRADVVSTGYADKGKKVYRLFETYDPGTITYSLNLGTATEIGSPVPVALWNEVDPNWSIALDNPDDLFIVQETGVDELLMVHIPNGSYCQSDYDGLTPLLYAYNGVVTVAYEDYFATRARLLADESLRDSSGNLSQETQVIWGNTSSDLSGSEGDLLKAVEGSFGAEGHLSYQNDMLDKILMLAGISPAALGRGIEGSSVSGTALRLRMIQSLAEANNRRQILQSRFSNLLRMAALLDVYDFGDKKATPWFDADAKPTVELSEGIPVDALESATTAASLLSAGLASREHAVAIAQPQLTEEQVLEEVEKIEGSKEPNEDVPSPTERLKLSDIV